MQNTQQLAVEDLCRRYLSSMESDDLPAILALFTEDATATSPISGSKPVEDFYRFVLQITSDRSMLLKSIFISTSSPLRAAIHMLYTRTVKGRLPSTIECVDVFDLNEDCSRFTGVKIIYDTAEVHSEFDARQ